jgi:ABC-type multidrug transport system ATPase subunit
VRLETLALGQYTRGGTREVLREVSLRIAPGQVTAIAGSSGAGKTTLLETLAGIRRPASGRVLHEGADPAALRSALGFVPQDWRSPAPWSTRLGCGCRQTRPPARSRQT